MRDDFSEKVKRIIALRVNYLCSNPLCGASTTGPKVKSDETTNVGVAAHITAASPGGKRYNPLLTKRERKAPENGIWCCQVCGKKIDDDEQRFTVALLQDWKKKAEERATQRLGKPSPFNRNEAPSLNVFSAYLAPHSSTNAESISSKTLSELCKLMPEKFHNPQELKLLNSGQGALGQPYAIVGSGVNSGWDWNVSLFSAGEFGWEMIASIQLASQKGWTPEALYVPGMPGALAITHVHGWGTGLFRRSTSWYQIARKEPRPLLSYAQNFYICGGITPYCHKLASKPLKLPEHLTQGELLVLQFAVTYSAIEGSTEEDLFTLFDMLHLEWDETTNSFVPHTSFDDPTRIEEIWNSGGEQFIRRNRESLNDLLENGTASQKEFIETQLLYRKS